MKKGKRLAILIVVAVLFGAGSVLLQQNTSQQQAAKDAATTADKPVLMTLDTQDATALRYTRDGETVDLSMQNGQWVYTPRTAFALDSDKVQTMLSSLATVDAVRSVTDNSDALADYGLAQPALRITATAGDGTAQTLLVGDQNVATGNYYAAMEGKAEVYTISSDVYNAFDLPLMDLLIAEAYPSVSTEAVTGLTYADQGGQTTLEYHANGDASAYSSAFQWFRKGVDGALAPVDSDAVDTYLSAATAITYAGTANDTKADLATYGLDAPKLTLTLHYTEAVPQSQAAAAIEQDPAALLTPTPTATSAPAATQPGETATAAATQAAATGVATATATPAATATTTAAAKSTPTITVAPTATATPATVTPTAAISGSASAALAEDAAAVPAASDVPTATPTATPEPTVDVQRALTLWFGGTDADGNVYMTHSKTDRIFTVSAETYASLAALSADGLKVTHPAYLSIADITGMTATMGDTTKTVTAQSVSETASDGTPTVKTVYQVDGPALKTGALNLLVGSLKAIKAEGYTDQPVATDAQPAFQAVFTQSRAGFETLRVAFYPYDASFMQAAVGTDTTMLVNKRDVANLQTYLDGLVAAEPTATPAASAAP